MTPLQKKIIEICVLLPTMSILGFILSDAHFCLSQNIEKLIIAKFETVL